MRSAGYEVYLYYFWLNSPEKSISRVAELVLDRRAEMLADNEKVQAALDRATRDALLEHARMGRSVCESRDGQVVWIPPVEVFARYGLDEFGRPLPTETA